MPSFLSDIAPFMGTGERNAAGQTLKDFLDAYNPRKYETPACTTDAVIFLQEGLLNKELAGLKLLLVKRSNHPSIGCWALPGGFANMRENLDDTAKRELQEETGASGLPMEQIATYGDYNRDPRTRVITTAYMSLIRGEDYKIQAADDAADAAWCHVMLEEIFAGEDCGTLRYRYRLTLESEEKGLCTEAIVERKLRKGIIREEKFTVKEAGMTAVDHAAIIVHAMCILKQRL